MQLRWVGLFFWLGLLVALAGAQEIPGMKRTDASAFVSPEKQWAVLVGVSEYLHLPKSEWLDSCDKDALALAEFLRSPRGGAFPADQVKVLVNQSATTQAVRLALDALIKKVQAGDVVYLFFACHGRVEAYGGGQVAYLLPYDSDDRSLNASAIPMDEIRRYVDVNLRHCLQVVLISDACHAGALGPSENSVNDWIQGIGERSGALNIMACRRDEKAAEDPKLGGHGVLTYCLLQALSGDGNSTSEGVVRAQDVLEYMMRNVPRLTDQLQHPRHSSNYKDEFPMAQLKLPGPTLYLPRPPADATERVANQSSLSLATLRVYGAALNSEVYLVQGREQRTVGRVLSQGNSLLLEGIAPGHYVLVQSLNGKQSERKIELTPGLHSLDLGGWP